jgi:hypothetical protein
LAGKIVTSHAKSSRPAPFLERAQSGSLTIL